MSDPRPSVVFALLKLGLAGNSPREERLADGRKVQLLDDTRQRDNPRFDITPRLAATSPQTLPAHIACESFGGSCFRNWHVE